MVFDRFLEWLNVQEDYTTRLSIDPVSIIDQTINSFTQALLASYDVLDDDKRMRERLFGLAKGSTEQRDMFDALRREYPVRREFGSTVIDVGGQTEGAELKSTLAAVGFLLA
jgi:erythronate-4-phosphate dehydrogenase